MLGKSFHHHQNRRNQQQPSLSVDKLMIDELAESLDSYLDGSASLLFGGNENLVENAINNSGSNKWINEISLPVVAAVGGKTTSERGNGDDRRLHPHPQHSSVRVRVVSIPKSAIPKIVKGCDIKDSLSSKNGCCDNNNKLGGFSFTETLDALDSILLERNLIGFDEEENLQNDRRTFLQSSRRKDGCESINDSADENFKLPVPYFRAAAAAAGNKEVKSAASVGGGSCVRLCNNGSSDSSKDDSAVDNNNLGAGAAGGRSSQNQNDSSQNLLLPLFVLEKEVKVVNVDNKSNSCLDKEDEKEADSQQSNDPIIPLKSSPSTTIPKTVRQILDSASAEQKQDDENLLRPASVDFVHFVFPSNHHKDNDHHTKTSTDLQKVLVYAPNLIRSREFSLLFVVYQVLTAIEQLLRLLLSSRNTAGRVNRWHLLRSFSLAPAHFRWDSYWLSYDVIGALLELETVSADYDGRKPATSTVEQEEKKIEDKKWGLNKNVSSSTTPQQQQQQQTMQSTTTTRWEMYRNRPLWNATEDWTAGRLSNLDYLLVLNHFVGRRHGQPDNHPIVPWVVDFSLPEGGWRDLSQTKYRLNKGDHQLDTSYEHSCYHVPELLSDLGYYVYRARVEQQADLLRFVRSQWVPQEYPGSMRRLYDWTPDEAIPEFYTDPAIFTSRHEDLMSIELPSWTDEPKAFIRWHRSMLECDFVSQRLNQWIDLVFGYRLTGADGIEAKNIHLASSAAGAANQKHGASSSPFIIMNNSDQSCGIVKHGAPVQLFSEPHPKKLIKNQNLNTLEECCSIIMSPLLNFNHHSRQIGRIDDEGELSQRQNEESTPPTNLCELIKGIYQRQIDNEEIEFKERIGSLIMTICFPESYYGLPVTQECVPERTRISRHILTHRCNEIPWLMRRGLNWLFGNDEAEIEGYVPLLGSLAATHPLTSPFPFPPFLYPLHETFQIIHDLNYNRRRQTHLLFSSGRGGGPPEDILANMEKQINLMGTSVVDLLDDLSDEAVELVTVWVRKLALSQPSPAAPLAIWTLFAPLSARLSLEQLRWLFGDALASAYNVDAVCSHKHLKLYHRSFLLQLIVRFGMKGFLADYLPLIVQAACGVRDMLLMNDEEYLTEILSSMNVNETTTSLNPAGSERSNPSTTASTIENNNSSSSASLTEVQMKSLMSPIDTNNGCGDNGTGITSSFPPQDTTKPHTLSYTARDESEYSAAAAADVAVDEEEKDSVDEVTSSSRTTSSSMRMSSDIVNEVRVSEVARESLAWLADRFGPVLTANHINQHLLSMLSVVEPESISGPIDGLLDMAHIYGDAFLLLQYVPHIDQVIRSCHRRLGVREERALFGCLALLESIAPYFTDKQLMDNLEEVMVDGILFPAVRLFSSARLKFPNLQIRLETGNKIINCLHKIGVRVGPDNFKRYMAASLQRLLCSYDILFRVDISGNIKSKNNHPEELAGGVDDSQLRQIFTAEFAAKIYRLFGNLCGKRYFEFSLPNSVLLMTLIETVSNSTAMKESERSTETPVIKKLEKCDRHLTGNWLAFWKMQMGKGNGHGGTRKSMMIMSPSSAALDQALVVGAGHGNNHNQSLALNQVKLMTLTGHTGAVRRLRLMDNENSLMSASADKTVALWSLRSYGDGGATSEPQWVYKEHRKSVLDVQMVHSTKLVVSMDSNSMHIWDPFMGSSIREFDAASSVVNSGCGGGAVGSGGGSGGSSGSGGSGGGGGGGGNVEFVAMDTLNHPSNTVVVATSDNLVKLIVITALGLVNGPFNDSGSIRSMATDSQSHMIVLGLSSGHFILMDTRTGEIMNSRKLADAELNMVNDCGGGGGGEGGGGGFSVVLPDHPVSIWSYSDGKLKTKLGVNCGGNVGSGGGAGGGIGGPNNQQSSSASSMESYINGVVAVECWNGSALALASSYSNRVRVYGELTRECEPNDCKLRSDVLSGTLSALTILPLNEMWLLGSSNGTIQALC